MNIGQMIDSMDRSELIEWIEHNFFRERELKEENKRLTEKFAATQLRPVRMENIKHWVSEMPADTTGIGLALVDIAQSLRIIAEKETNHAGAGL